MEQAINNFVKGLLTDTHPMVTGNDVMTDCLNGTLVTMSGDEVILQNDMGNRRVDLAFLPAGYEPIGMKEYGGIIYVVAYNPITNKSQIGSFPSPLRRYISDDSDDVTFDPILSNNTSPFNRYDLISDLIYVITSDTYLIKLKNKPLCPGDKFLTTIDSDCSGYLSNWNLYNSSNNTLNRKNKLYTLSYGVLNSYNLFVDITKNLIRWDVKNNNLIMISESGNTEVSFNSGYFLPTKKPNVEYSAVTIADLELEEARLLLEMNTYSGKLVGYPYIKVKLNHPVSFSYSHKGKIVKKAIDDNTAEDVGKLTIIGTIRYNCPIETPTFNDNTSNKNIFMLFLKNEISNNINQYINPLIYQMYDGGGNIIPIWDDSNVNVVNGISHSPRSLPISQNSMNQESYNCYLPTLLNIDSASVVLDETYDEFSNLYSITVKKTYDISPSKLFDGFIGIPVSDTYNNYIVGSLIQPISINPTLFGTNELYLNTFGWKKDKTGDLYIRYQIENYLYDDVEIYEIQIGLKDLTGEYIIEGQHNNLPYNYNYSNNFLYYTLPDLSISGVKLELANLIDRHYYEVEFRYKTKSNNIISSWNYVKDKKTSNKETYWLLNTPLLNDCYEYSNNDNYIENYCNRTYLQEQIFKKLTIIEYENNCKYFIDSSAETLDPDINKGNFFTLDENHLFVFSFKHILLTNITVNKNIKIKKEENYPADIGNIGVNIRIKNNKITSIDAIKDFIIGGGDNGISTAENKLNIKNISNIFTTVNITQNQEQILLFSTFYDFFVGLNNGDPVKADVSGCLFPFDVILDEMLSGDKYINNNFGITIHVDLRSRQVYSALRSLNSFDPNLDSNLTNMGYNIQTLSIGGDDEEKGLGKDKLIGYRKYNKEIYPPASSTSTNNPDKSTYPPSYKNQQGTVSNISEYSSHATSYTGNISVTGSFENSDNHSYIYLKGIDKNGVEKTLVLSSYYHNGTTLADITSTDDIKNTLLYYFGGTVEEDGKIKSPIRVYLHSSEYFVHTVKNVKDNGWGIYTKIDGISGVKVDFKYDINLDTNYIENENEGKGCYFTSSELDDNSENFDIKIISYEDFKNNLEYEPNQQNPLNNIDLVTGHSISNASNIVNPSNNRKLYYYSNGTYNLVLEGIKYITIDGKQFPTLNATTLISNNPTYCYIVGKYRCNHSSFQNVANDDLEKRTFYVLFNSLHFTTSTNSIYTAERLSL